MYIQVILYFFLLDGDGRGKKVKFPNIWKNIIKYYQSYYQSCLLERRKNQPYKQPNNYVQVKKQQWVLLLYF